MLHTTDVMLHDWYNAENLRLERNYAQRTSMACIEFPVNRIPIRKIKMVCTATFEKYRSAASCRALDNIIFKNWLSTCSTAVLFFDHASGNTDCNKSLTAISNQYFFFTTTFAYLLPFALTSRCRLFECFHIDAQLIWDQRHPIQSSSFCLRVIFFWRFETLSL